jgi:hypothetical protein
MYKQLNPFRKFVSIPFFLSLTLAACDNDKNIETNTPAHHISESESLAIPAAVALPANDPAGNERVSTFFADGVQKYKAQEVVGSVPLRYEWVFVAPQANLYDATNKKVGTHSAGPTWQLSEADSIFGAQFTPAKTAPSSDPNSIDWLLLQPKNGKIATGVFANVAYIQRIATVGGKAPSNAPENATQTAERHYTAIYRFTRKR